MKIYTIAILMFGLVISCHSFKKAIPISQNTNNVDRAIQTAINDFSRLKRLHKNDKIFYIMLEKKSPNNSLMIISIISENSKLLVTKEVIIGSKGKIASRYIEKGGKLYYWWDNNYPLTQDALSIFGKYGLLQDDEGGKITFPDSETDDAKKGASYYFCKDNPTKFKRVITNIAVGYYNPPVLDCDSLK